MYEGWVDGSIEPKEDGYYIVMVGYDSDQLRRSCINFTVKGGWCTYGEDAEDERGNENYINSDGWIKAWFAAPPYKLENVVGRPA